jgi:hypothetical protein
MMVLERTVDDSIHIANKRTGRFMLLFRWNDPK